MKRNCYLCGQEAVFDADKGVAEFPLVQYEIDCKNSRCCGRLFRVSVDAVNYYFDHDPPILDEVDKRKLIEYVKCQPENRIPVLSRKIIEEETGKLSIGEL